MQIRTFLIMFASFIALMSVPASAGAVTIDTTEREMVAKINSYRQAYGKVPLKMELRLSNTATWMSADMPRYSYFAHNDHMGRDPFKRMTAFKYPTNTYRGENLAAGYADVDSTFTQWKNSQGHNKNMLNGSYRAIGISKVCISGSTYNCYWTTNFGSQVVTQIL